MSNNKMLDGIKKIGGNDLKKARKVVLDFIGEKDKYKKAEISGMRPSQSRAPSLANPSEQTLGERRGKGGAGREGKTKQFSKPMRIDGIFSKNQKIKKTKAFFDEKIKKKSDAIKKRAAIKTDNQKKIAQTLAAEEKAKLQLAELEKLKNEQTRLKQQTINKKEIEREREKLKKIVKKTEKQKIKKEEGQKVKKIKEEAKKQKQAEKKRVKLEKIKQQEEKRIMQKIAKIKKRLDRKKGMNEFKQNIIELSAYSAKCFKISGKIFSYVTLILIIVIILGYCAFSIALLNFHLDNNTARIISRYMPAPALITAKGAVEYYHYKDTENEIKNYYFNKTGLIPDKIELSKKTEEKLVKELLIKQLARKYNLQNKDKKIIPQSLKEKVAGKIAFDQEINQDGLFKIRKIQSVANKKENFNQVARTYGDESSPGAYYSINDAAAKFGPSAVNLAVGQISDIITTNSGYYLVECYGRRDDLLGLKYVFVKCKTLGQYLDEEIIKTKVWNLVD